MADIFEDGYFFDNIDDLLRGRVVNLVALVVDDDVGFINFDTISDIVPREVSFSDDPNVRDIALCILLIDDLVGMATLDISMVTVWD